MEQNACPETLLEAARYFSDKYVTHDFAASIIYPDGVACPRCGGANPTFYRNRLLYRCSQCKRQFTLKVGTIFEDSPLGLDKWLVAMWQIANCKNGISSWELHRAIDVTQKTAWFMLHRIRLAMQSGSFKKLGGQVEADETFVGGLEKNKHEYKKIKRGRGSVGKAVVAGMLERGGGVVARVVPDTTARTLHEGIHAMVEPGSDLFTDAHKGYRGLNADYKHEVVDHTYEYVRGTVHTNGMENFWSLLKRTIKGTYVSVDVVHLDAYLDEQAFRFNERGGNDSDRFQKSLSQVAGKRLTYEQLKGCLS